ncbi:MAG: hypothetical protein A2W25_11865 [candidate division Zixibacteria bacterium RBG_16_53_22]|nr:MAG: hypothetical protein A2W25_11865 [candidate division Zixibacteria bacterium RBG_16_53_22]
MKLAHVSLFKRHHGNEYHAGGVEKFAFFLNMAFPEMKCYSIQDLPIPIQPGTPDYKIAEILNNWLLGEGLVDENTTVIGDGFWTLGLEGKVGRLISVIHGAYFGTALEYEKYPNPEETHVGEWALIQEEVWKDPRVEVVSVSNRSALELMTVCGIPSHVISHGLPLDIYKPDGKPKSRLVLHTSVSFRKGRDMIEKIKAFGKFDIQQLGFARSGDMAEEVRLWNRGGIFLNPTRFEGNHYSILEALACGLVPVAYLTGVTYDFPCHVAETTDDFHEHRFVMMLENAMEYYSNYFPREWACENLDFDIWAAKWRAYLK